MNRMICPNYVGISCVNGSCPKANIEMYEEYGIPCVHSCKECTYYKGCEDCADYGCNEALRNKYQNK